MTRSLAVASVLACCTAWLLASHPALAKPKIALTQIDGDASGDVREAVVEALEGKELSLIGAKEVNRAVDKLGDAGELSEKDLKKLAAELEADAIVIGKLDKAGKSKSLKFRLFVHKKLAKGFTVNFKDAKSEKFQTLLHDKIIDKIGVAPGGGDDEDKPAGKKKLTAEDEEDPLAAKADKKPKKTKKPKAGDDDEADARPRKPARADADEEADARPKKPRAKADDEDRPKRLADAAPTGSDDIKARKADDDPDADARPKKKVAAAEDSDELEGTVSTASAAAARSPNRPAVRLDVGASVVQHSFTFNTQKTDTSPRNTSLKPVPGARVSGEIYPLMLTDTKGALTKLGIAFDYDRTLALKLTSNANNATTSIAVKQSHYSFGLRYRLAFGTSETASTLTFGADYGKRLFAPNRGGLADDQLKLTVSRDTPTSEDTLVAPGLTFRLPVTRKVALSLGGRGMLITNTGSIQSTASYGRAKVYGAEGVAAVDVILTSRFALRFAGEFVQLGYTFQGNGQLSNGLDGDMATQEVGGLADRSLGGSVTLGVLY